MKKQELMEKYRILNYWKEYIEKKKPIEIFSPSVIGKKEKHKLTKTITSRNSIKLH